MRPRFELEHDINFPLSFTFQLHELPRTLSTFQNESAAHFTHIENIFAPENEHEVSDNY